MSQKWHLLVRLIFFLDLHNTIDCIVNEIYNTIDLFHIADKNEFTETGTINPSDEHGQILIWGNYRYKYSGFQEENDLIMRLWRCRCEHTNMCQASAKSIAEINC